MTSNANASDSDERCDDEEANGTTARASSNASTDGDHASTNARGKMRVETCETMNAFEPLEMESRGKRGKMKPTLGAGAFHALVFGECACAAALLLTYSMIGFGSDVYGGLTKDEYWRLSWAVAGGSIVLFGILWILGAAEAVRQREWRAGKYLSFFFAAIAAGGLVVSGLLSIKEYETLPFALYVLLKAGLVRVMKLTLCRETHNGSFLIGVAIASYIVAALSAGLWLFWVYNYEKRWSTSMFNKFELAMGCSNATDVTNAGADPGGCGNAAYMMWGAPLAVVGLNIVYGAAATQLSKKGGALQIVMILALIVAFGLWISVALSGVEMGIADNVIQLSIVFCALFGIACFITAGPNRIYRQIQENKLTTKVIGYSQTELAKALLFCVTAPLIPFGLAISALSSAARKIGISLYKKPKEDPQDGILTMETQAILNWWFAHPTKVLLYSAYLSIFYWTFTIGVGKGAVLFLAWLVDALAGFSRAAVILLFVFIGVCMFLLPPVPGPPVYLTGGILIVGNLEPDYGFWKSTAACVAVCWFTKLLASAMQQKLIGEQLSGNVQVRKMVGINSLQMRAIRYCLEMKGLTVPKVAILCGGPDWPTSVLCGILRLSVIQCTIGTMPVLVLFLAYTTIAGALQLKIGSCGTGSVSTTSEEYWNMLNSIFLALAFISMTVTSFGAVYYMEKTIETKREILDAMPVDEPVMELEKVQEEREDAYQMVSQWSALSTSSKVLLWFSALTGILSCELGVVLSQRAFASFSVSCPVAVKDVIKPAGWVSIGLIILCTIFAKTFTTIQDKRADRLLSKQKIELSSKA